MNRPIITLTTDFGSGNSYVAQMKGVILAINPDVTLVDLTHSIPPQEIRQGALLLAEVTPLFPADSLHVAVVDPGVGTGRKLLYARIGAQQYLAPDNGLLTGLAHRGPVLTMVELRNEQFWRPEQSRTFHGRDILSPVAAWLSRGVAPEQLGPATTEMVHLDWPEATILANKIEGEVISVDSFGNLITNITCEMLGDAPRDERVTIHCDEHETQGIYGTYAEQPPMTLIALVGSSGRLELAIVNDSAKIMLGVGTGVKVTVTW